MAQPPHFYLDKAVYLITTATINRTKLFKDPQIAQLLVDSLQQGEEKWGYKLYAYVIMPDHIHVIIEPLKGKNLSRIMNQIKGASSRKINSILKQSGRLWQKGFHDFTIYGEKKFREKFNYVHYNPVKWSIVEHAEDYPFSSAKYYKNMCNAVYYE